MNESLELPRQIRKFNPGTLQSDEEVIRQFVVRKPKLGIVLEVLRGNIDSPSCQHVLLVAPRGRGKSMLLARVAAELRSNREFSERLLPVRFMEESQEIFDLTDFWLESLFYLAKASKMCDPELAQELQDVHADLTAEWRGQDLEERARATVLEAADRLGRKLALMVENLQALCGNVDDDFGWKLRGALQSEPQIILLATATSRFKGLDDAREPFFELFRIIRLEPLDTEECRRLWQMVSGDVVTRREIRPLEILTGGNPRLLVIIGDFARHRSLRQLMEELVRLIDDHTEYFRFLVGMALFCKGAALGMLGEVKAALIVCDEFLGRFGDSDAAEIQGAIVKTLFNKGVSQEMLGETEAALLAYGNVVARFGDSHAPGIQVAVARALVNKGYRQGRLGNVEMEIAAYDEVIERFGDNDESSIQEEVAGALSNKVVALGLLGKTDAEMAACDDVAERFGDSDATVLQVHVAHALANKAGAQVEIGRAEKALCTCDEIERRLESLTGSEKIELEWRSRWVRTKALLVLQQDPAAMDAFCSVYTKFDPRDEAMMREMLARVPDLIANGALERDLVEILSSDREKADTLLPLLVALRQRTGETVRAPAEVQAVAADIRELIEAMVGSGDTAP